MSAGDFSRMRVMAVLRSRPFLTVRVVALVWIVAELRRRAASAPIGHLRYLVELAAVIGLVAAGQTFVVIAGGIDLSVAAIVTVSAVGLPLLRPGRRSDRPHRRSSRPGRWRRRSASSTASASPCCASIR